MKNYPEYPDNCDVYIKDLAEQYGITDYNVAKAVMDAADELSQFSICYGPFVAAAIRHYDLHKLATGKKVNHAS
jgi:hypothetical protein